MSSPTRFSPRVVFRDAVALLVVPIVLTGIYLFVPSSMQEMAVFRPDAVVPSSLLFSAYLHLTEEHLIGNIYGYVLGAGYAYVLCFGAKERRWFWLTTLAVLLVLPIAVNLSWLAIVQWAYPSLAIPARGFSGVASGFGGFLFVSLLVFLRQDRSSGVVLDTGYFVLLVLLGVLLVIYAPTSLAWLAVGAIGLGLAVVDLIRRSVRGGPSIDWVHVWRDVVVAAFVSAVLAMLVIGLFPGQPVSNGVFTNVFAHAIGFVYGAVMAGWGYRYWGSRTSLLGEF